MRQFFYSLRPMILRFQRASDCIVCVSSGRRGGTQDNQPPNVELVSTAGPEEKHAATDVKRNEMSVAAARERFLARKNSKSLKK